MLLVEGLPHATKEVDGSFSVYQTSYSLDADELWQGKWNVVVNECLQKNTLHS